MNTINERLNRQKEAITFYFASYPETAMTLEQQLALFKHLFSIKPLNYSLSWSTSVLFSALMLSFKGVVVRSE